MSQNAHLRTHHRIYFKIGNQHCKYDYHYIPASLFNAINNKFHNLQRRSKLE